MEKSRKISLFIVTAIFFVVMVFKMVDMLTNIPAQVGEVSLEGPAVVKVGEFNQDDYRMLVKYGDKTEEYKPFLLVYIAQEDVKKLEQVGKHTINFTYEQVRGKFEIEIIE